MSARLAAAAALLCTLFGAGRANAEDPVARRPVAVIELSDTDDGRKLALDLLFQLNRREDLKPLDRPELQASLTGPNEDKDATGIRDARRNKQLAEDELSGYKFPEAARKANEGRQKLIFVTPTPPVLTLYAELSFVLGAARLGERQPEQANGQFRLAHAVDPAFKPDAIRYLPEVVQAYELAIKAKVPTGKLSVTGTGKVILDGHDAGEVNGAPLWLDAIAGPHVVWLTGPDRQPRAKEVVAEANRKLEVPIEDARFGPDERVWQLKTALKTAPDSTIRAIAMQNLATFLQVGDAVIVSGANGKLIIQTWRDRAPGFSALREFKEGADKPADVLEPLGNPKKIVIAPPPRICPVGFELIGAACVKKKPPIDERAWWQKRKYRIAGGVAAGVVLGVVIYGLSTWERTFKNNNDAGFESRRP